VETIEQSAQEALRSREEIRAVETTKVQRRELFLTPEAHTRGFLLMEEEQRVIDQLQNDPDLVEMMRVPTDNPIKIGEDQVTQSRYKLKKPPGQITLKFQHHRSDHQGKFQLRCIGH
jgi:hypothetical protein